MVKIPRKILVSLSCWPDVGWFRRTLLNVACVPPRGMWLTPQVSVGPAHATDDGDCFWRCISSIKAGGFCGMTASLRKPHIIRLNFSYVSAWYSGACIVLCLFFLQRDAFNF